MTDSQNLPPFPFPNEPAPRGIPPQQESPALPVSGAEERLPLGGMGIPILLFILSIYFWDSFLVYPIKILTVFFHELSHGLAAILTGGSIAKIEIMANEAGVCWTTGGNRFIILSAGYLGSLLWGSLLFLAASLSRQDRVIVSALGALLIAVTLFWVRTTAGIVFGFGFGVAMIAFAKYFGEVGCDQLLRYLGLTSSFYVILDIKSDLIDHSIGGSDASELGKMLLVPGWVIGVIWFLVALAISYKVLMIGWKNETPRL